MSTPMEQLLLTDDYGAAAKPQPRNDELSLFEQFRLKFKSDEALVVCLQDGNPDALTILFQRHSALVFRIARRILREDAEAEDAVQQTFLDVFRARLQFDSEKGSFKAWLLMFAYHRTFNKRRQLLSHGFYQAQEIEEALPELLEGARRAFLNLSAETFILLDEALAQLQPRQRRTIELVYYEGLTAEEIAARTRESVRVVRHNLYRGMEKLRSILKAPVDSRKR